MLVLVLPPLSSRVSGFPVASPCLWRKLQNLSFCHVANCENWRKSRTKCWFFCIHVSCLESLVFLWRRRVYGGSWKSRWFSCDVAVSMGEAGKPLLFDPHLVHSGESCPGKISWLIFGVLTFLRLKSWCLTLHAGIYSLRRIKFAGNNFLILKVSRKAFLPL